MKLKVETREGLRRPFTGLARLVRTVPSRSRIEILCGDDREVDSCILTLYVSACNYRHELVEVAVRTAKH